MLQNQLNFACTIASLLFFYLRHLECDVGVWEKLRERKERLALREQGPSIKQQGALYTNCFCSKKQQLAGPAIHLSSARRIYQFPSSPHIHGVKINPRPLSLSLAGWLEICPDESELAVYPFDLWVRATFERGSATSRTRISFFAHQQRK